MCRCWKYYGGGKICWKGRVRAFKSCFSVVIIYCEGVLWGDRFKNVFIGFCCFDCLVGGVKRGLVGSAGRSEG